MYAGHVGIALGAHGLRRAVPLWLLIIASQLPDWTDAALCLSGIRPEVPGMYSHSLPAVLVLAAIASGAFFAFSRDWEGILLVAAVVLSHVLMDYVTGIKPLWPGGAMIGLQLYHAPAIDFVIETVVVIAGWFLYRPTLDQDRRSTAPVFTLLGALLAAQLAADIFMSLSPGLRKC
ncbi:MAG: metal-dependent hydrolase [Gemmatimonadaceae bacterium]